MSLDVLKVLASTGARDTPMRGMDNVFGQPAGTIDGLLCLVAADAEPRQAAVIIAAGRNDPRSADRRIVSPAQIEQ
jgi:hypothetical protein